MSLLSSGKILGARLLCAAAMCFGFAVSAVAQTLDHFDFSNITSPKYSYAPFRIIITAESSTGATVRTYTGTPVLTAVTPLGPVPVETIGDLKFTSGQWVGTVIVTEPGTSVQLRVNGGGRTSLSPAFDVLPTNFRVLDLPVISLVSDQTRHLLYASVGPTNGAFGTIHVIDPATGSILDSHLIPGGVERLEMKNLSTLYVVSDDQLRVRRLGLPDFAEEASFTFGESEPGYPNYARDVAAHPTRPNVFAVVKGTRRVTPWFTGVSVFEGNSEKTTPSVYLAEANVVHWGTDATRLYGFENTSTPNTFSLYELTETNLNPVATKWNLFTGFNGDIEFLKGRLYCSTGRIIDPETLTLLAELPNGHNDAVMVPIPLKKRIVYFTPSTLGQMLTYDSDTFQLVGAEPWPGPRGYGSGAVFWGNNGIAFHDGKRLYLTENAAIPAGVGSADLQVTANAGGPIVVAGTDHEMSARVKNLGPTAAASVVMRMSSTLDTVFTGGSVQERNATVTQLGNIMTLEFDSMAVGEELEVKFSANSIVPAWQPISIIAIGADFDMNGTNNSALAVLRAQPLPTLEANAVLRLGASALVADRTRGKLIITPNSASAPFGNTVMIFDPSTGEITQPVWVGSRPSELAISDDGQYLFVGFLGVPEVRRFTLPALQHDLTIPLGVDGFIGPRFAVDIAVRPGHPSEIAVASGNTYTSSTAVSMQPDQFGYFHNATDLTPDRGEPFLVRFADADRLVTYGDFGDLHWFDVTDQTITWNKYLRNVNPSDAPGVAPHEGKLYFSDGNVYDATTGTKVGQYSFFGPYGPGPILDGASNRAMVVTRGLNEQIISVFDMTSLDNTGSATVTATIGNINGFARWSGDGFALSGTTGVAMWHSDLFLKPPEQLKVTETIINAENLILRFSNLAPGFYGVIESTSLDGPWSVVGNALFRETMTEFPVPLSSEQKFFRLARFQ
jgi:hypothetical protein